MIDKCAADWTLMMEQDCRVIQIWSVRCGEDMGGGVGLQGCEGWSVRCCQDMVGDVGYITVHHESPPYRLLPDYRAWPN